MGMTSEQREGYRAALVRDIARTERVLLGLEVEAVCAVAQGAYAQDLSRRARRRAARDLKAMRAKLASLPLAIPHG